MKKMTWLCLTACILGIFDHYCRAMEALEDERTSPTTLQVVAKDPAEEKKHVVVLTLPVPLAARGHEEIYQRFLNGAVIYRPNPESDVGQVILPIANLRNQLTGTFDLSQCKDSNRSYNNADNYLYISTGYRKQRTKGRSGRIEVWIAPRFLIEKELDTTACHFRSVFSDWKESAPVGIFWTSGNWHDSTWYNYLIYENFDDLSKNTLDKKLESANFTGGSVDTSLALFPFGQAFGVRYYMRRFQLRF